MGRRKWILSIGLLLGAGGAAWAFEAWHFHRQWRLAHLDVTAGKYASAIKSLRRLADRGPAESEILYDLGTCELAIGRPDQAEAAWSRIAPTSSAGPRAALMRARLALKQHQLTAAEVLLPVALKDPGKFGKEARETLVHLFKLQGRYEEARRLVRDGWGSYDPVGTIQELVRLDTDNPIPIEKVRPTLDTAYRASPGDDRIWLGFANLATRTGRFDEARKWLDACLRKRPDDPAVWRVRLDWARASEDEPEVRRCLEHLPDNAITPTQLLAVGIWIAHRGRDATTERRLLEEMIALDPGYLPALENLAEVLLRAGEFERARQLRSRKGDLERTLDWYVTKIFPEDRLEHAAELASAAEKVNRKFEARCWWTLAAERPERAAEARTELTRLDQEVSTSRPRPSSLTPAGLLAWLGSTSGSARNQLGDASAGAVPSFVDDSETAGLRFTFDNGLEELHQMPETMSGGIGLLDYDGDGWMDVYAVQGGQFPPDPSHPNAGDRLFRNLGNGHFQDVSQQSGIAALPRGYGHGVTVGDFDNDGMPDLFLTRWQAYALFRNKGDGTFEDVTEKAGLSGDRDWPTSAAFADLDGDGDLDLYVCHYVDWDSKNPKPCVDPARKIFIFCGPPMFPSRQDHLFRNDQGRFVDVTTEAGIIDPNGQGLGVLANDFNGDGLIDLFVANDQSAKYLFLNRGGLRFEEVGHQVGIASNASGFYQASMGVACADANADGLPDVTVTNFYNEYTALYLNLGNGIFSDHSQESGLAIPSRYRLGFGIGFLDFNNDGWLDLATACGHVDDNRTDVAQKMPAQLFAGLSGGGRFVDVTEKAGPPFQTHLLGRGLATGDLDNDGRMDFLILNQNQPLTYFHNRTRDGGHSVTVQLVGGPSNRGAVGSRVVVTAGGRRQVGWRIGGASYQSASDPRLHFGLGAAERVEAVEVTWPTGKVEVYRDLSAEAGFLLREGDARARPLPGFGKRAREPEPSS